jgi:hypothetical protein
LLIVLYVTDNKDFSDRLDNISNNGNDNSDDDSYKTDKYDDEYYLDQNRDSPRLYLYKQARAEKWQACITQDELDYRLKERLRLSPAEILDNIIK